MPDKLDKEDDQENNHIMRVIINKPDFYANGSD